MKLVIAQRDRVLEYPLETNVITLGCAEDNDIAVEDSHASGYHAIIRRQDSRFHLFDAGSRHGTRVNEELLQGSRVLRAGDRIRIGHTVLILLEDDETLEQPEPLGEPALSKLAAAQYASAPPNHLPARRRTRKALAAFPSPAAARGLIAFLKSGLALLEGRSNRSGSFQPGIRGLWERANLVGKGIYGTVIAGPAFLLTGWQKFLELAGVEAEGAFPEGTWQFYTGFGLREDPARHANETTGFHEAVPEDAQEIDLICAWLYQIILTYFEYDALLENEWVERVLLRLIDEALDEAIAEELARQQATRWRSLSPDQRAQLKEQVRRDQPERVEIGREERKSGLGLAEMNVHWVKKRPYKRDESVEKETYPQYRRRIFLSYLAEMADKLPPDMGARIWEEYHKRSETDLPAYQEQMTILKALTPGRYKDEKEPIPLWQAKVGLVLDGRYYLFDAAARDENGHLLIFDPHRKDDEGIPLILKAGYGDELRDQHGRLVSIDRKGNVAIEASHLKVLRPVSPRVLKAQVRYAQQARRGPTPFDTDLLLAAAPRAQQRFLRGLLPPRTREELQALRKTPAILHWDVRPLGQPLGLIRRGRRGIGDHALTIFRTASSFVFDMSHIFYDAIWGAALSQIITDGAVEQYRLFARLPSPSGEAVRPVEPLVLECTGRFRRAAEPYQRLEEVVAESDEADLGRIYALRRALRDKEGIYITVNDILTLYRSLHDALYVPGVALQLELARFKAEAAGDPEAMALTQQIERIRGQMLVENPSLLIPMDASFIAPKLRLQPTTFRNPWPNLVDMYRAARRALEEAERLGTSQSRASFVSQRRVLLDHLLALAEYFAAMKRITRNGESFNVATIKLLAHLPSTMQGTLDLIPQRIGVLNEIIKGQEVFSNVGQVAPGSSLVRFMSAKDDGDAKELVWGIMSTKEGLLKLTLRDFRKHVGALIRLGRQDLAQLITQDYLDSYAHGLNVFVDDLRDITLTTFD
jgi:hypothetical protein